MTEAQIIQAVREALSRAECPEDAFTSTELSELCGLHPDTIKGRLRVLKSAGRLRVTQKKITTIDNRTVYVPAYRIVDPP